MMKILKKITLLRLYFACCVLALSGFTYAEYYGYEILGSDEGPRSTTGGHSGSGSSAHHK